MESSSCYSYRYLKLRRKRYRYALDLKSSPLQSASHPVSIDKAASFSSFIIDKLSLWTSGRMSCEMLMCSTIGLLNLALKGDSFRVSGHVTTGVECRCVEKSEFGLTDFFDKLFNPREVGLTFLSSTSLNTLFIKPIIPQLADGFLVMVQ